MTIGSNRVFGLARTRSRTWSPSSRGSLRSNSTTWGSAAEVAAGVLAGRKEVIERFDAVANDDDVVGDLVLAKGAQRQIDVVRIVFDEKNLVHFTRA